MRMRPIKEYSKYWITDDGRVWSVYRNTWKTVLLDKKGYCRVQLKRDDGKLKNKRIHRLVASAFIPNPENKSDVNHKDMEKTNNNISNLEWTTSAENKYHAITHNPQGVLNAVEASIAYCKEHPEVYKKRSESSKKPVRCIETGKLYNSAIEVCEDINCHRMSVGHAIRQKKKLKGFHFVYISKEEYDGSK